MIRGKGIKRGETVSSGKPCIRYGEIYTSYNTCFDKTLSFIPNTLYNACNLIVHGDVVFTLTGENKPDIAKAIAYIGDEPVAAGGDLAYWTVHGMNPLYLSYFLNGPYCIEMKKRLATGDIIVHISTEKIGSFLIPIPPLKEQDRIVERIKHIEPLINEYSKCDKSISVLSEKFPEILKKSILQQAVMGKLVPQDPNDEPASVLLERIRAEKQALIKAGKLKKDKHESIIYRRDNSHYEKLDGVERCIDDEIPFDIPYNWCWCRLGELGDTNIGLTYKPSDKTVSGGVLVLRSSNIQEGVMDYADCVYVSCEIPEKAMIHKGDLLICARNGSRSLVGKCAIVDKDGMAFGAFMAKFKSPYNPYIKLFLDSPIFRNQLDGVKTGTINQITQEMLKNQLIPIPPLCEQNRIINEVNRIVPYLAKL